MASENYRIRYTPLAYEDLDEIDTYISTVLLNPQAALDLLGEMEESKGYRKLAVQNYLVFHLVDQAQKEVVVMRVMYGAREYRSLL